LRARAFETLEDLAERELDPALELAPNSSSSLSRPWSSSLPGEISMPWTPIENSFACFTMSTIETSMSTSF